MLEHPLPGQPAAMQPTYAHSRTRTTSSNIFPIQIPSQAPMHLQQPPAGHARRSPSVNTFSTVSSGGMPPPPAAYRTSPTADIRRSTSTRSGSISHNSSYVALLRKQKATVWCDRSQHEDPQLLARQRAAKMRANRDIVGTGSGFSPSGTLSARTSTGLSSAGGKVAAKIRHHGKPGVVGYSPGDNYIGVGGVPLRLSATEVEGEDSDEEVMADLAAQMQQRLHHRRTGSSGRSSTTSARKAAAFRTSGGAGATGLPGSGSLGGRRWSPGDTPERAESVAEDQQANDLVGGHDDAASGKARSTASGSSAERADNVPDMGTAARLPTNSAYHAAITREKSVKTVEELKRRGSVDERTMTMSTGRLFIANPD